MSKAVANAPKSVAKMIPNVRKNHHPRFGPFPVIAADKTTTPNRQWIASIAPKRATARMRLNHCQISLGGRVIVNRGVSERLVGWLSDR